MTDFFDWLAAGDWGLAAERLREEFRLSQDEMRRTTEALAPAFLLGLQRATADPAAWSSMARVFPLPAPFSSGAASGLEAGGAMMAGLFGNGDLANAVARHASLFSGVAPDTITRMMPSLAAMTVETTMRMAGWRRDGQEAYPTDTAGRALAEMMRRSANAVEAFNQPSSASPSVPRPGEAGYLEFLFADALKGGFPWFGALRTDARATNMPFMPFGPFYPFAAMQGPASPPSVPTPASRADEKDGTPQPGSTPITDFVDSGRSFQEAYMRQMLSLFERHAPKGK